MKLCKDCAHFDRDGKTPELCWRKGVNIDPLDGVETPRDLLLAAKERRGVRMTITFMEGLKDWWTGGNHDVFDPTTCGVDAQYFQPKRVHALEILSCVPRDTQPSVDEVPDKEWCWIAEKESQEVPVGFCQWTCEQGDIIRGRMARVGRYVWLPLYAIPRPSVVVASQEALELDDEVEGA